ncbi:MAG: chromosome partitioning protein [Halieaceae bacterium]|jgi:chromosome partitioning protein
MSIIVCPRCSKQHSVDFRKIPDKKNVFAKCKSCSYKFPVNVEQLRRIDQSARPGLSSAKREARKICVTVSKGGVGKTTTAVSLAAGLALAGNKVLLVDTDTQGQSAYALGMAPPAGLAELLTGELSAEEALASARNNLWLLAGGRALAGAKRVIDRKSFGAEWTLSEAMAGLDEKFDYIIIDTSPGWDQLTVNVLFYATEILLPVALEVMPLHGLSEFMQSLNSIQKYRPVNLSYVLPTFLDDRSTQPRHIHNQLARLYSEQICDPIRYDEAFSSCPSFGKTIFEFAPNGRGAHDYRLLVNRIERGQPYQVNPQSSVVAMPGAA